MATIILALRARLVAWLGWILLALLAAWYTIDWLRTLIYATSSWGLGAGLIEGVAVLRLGEALIAIPLMTYALVRRQDGRFLSRARWVMWAGAALAGLSFVQLNGRIGWAPLTVVIAVMGLVVPVVTSMRRGCAARLVAPFSLVGLVLVHLLLLAAGFLLHGYAVVPYPAPYPRPAATAGERQQQDVRYLGSELARLHMNAYHTISEQAYWDEVARLEVAAANLAPEELALEMMRLVAGVGDGHTSFRGASRYAFHTLPVDFRWFGNELYVAGISEDYARAIGARVLEIGGMPAEVVYQAILPYIPHENEAWARVRSNELLGSVELLAQVGAVEEIGPVSLSLEGADKESLAVDVVPLESGQEVDFVSAWQQRPLYLSRPDLDFWYEYRPDSGSLYFRYAACVDVLGFRKTANELWQLVEEQPVERLIIDLRGNGGGNTYQFDQFFLPKLNAQPELNDPERLFVLIDRETFSSASDHAAFFRVNSKATLVGEPTGGKPNGYGEVRSFRLPNSGARVNYSTNYIRSMDVDMPSIEPDVVIYVAGEAAFKGKDPVLAYVVPGDWNR